MAFNGYLLKMGADIFPLSFVYKESYKVAPNRRQDLDSNRNANGILERNVLDHMPSTISFQAKPMYNNDLDKMMKFIREHFIVEKERKLLLTYYCPDINDYKEGEFYMPDIEFVMNMVDIEQNRILYNGFQLEFIEY